MSEGEFEKSSDEHTAAQGVASVAIPASKVDRLQRWLTLGANIGVLLGLFLVIIQINQNTELARSAYKSEGNVLSNNVWSQMIGDRIGDTIEKSIECPKEMTYGDFMALDAWLFTGINIIYRDYQLAQDGLYSEADWKGSVDLYVHWYLANPFGRAWWDEEARTFFPEDFAHYVGTQLSKGLRRDSQAHWLAIRARVTGDDPAERLGVCKVREGKPAADGAK